MKAVILAGGLGTRLREETEFRPKPMVEVGGKPILWHIMKLFAHHGIEDFVVPVGYKSAMIKDYFLNYEARNSDFTVVLGRSGAVEFHGPHDEASWRVSVVETGMDTNTGGRVKRVEGFVPEDRFIVTYGDGLADIDIRKLLAFHEAHGKLATLSTVRPPSRFGVLELGPGGVVERFREKPQTDGWISAGFFVFARHIFDYLDSNSVLEQEPLARLAREGELVAYQHDGFWQPMDTYRESRLLNELWDDGRAPWKVWN